MRREDARRPDKYVWHAWWFAVKPFVWLDAAMRGDGSIVWLDGDTLAHAPIPSALFSDALSGADVAYLGRARMHPETGYLGLRIPQAMALLHWMVDAYRSLAFRAWRDGWTDCHALMRGLAATAVRAHNLTASFKGGTSHVWPASPFAPFLAHGKGGKNAWVASGEGAIAC